MTGQSSAPGAQPSGAADEQSAARAVQGMFDSIAPRYDLLNHVLSLNIDRLWWWRTARRFRAVLSRPESLVLDVCCGTGDMTMALLRLRPRPGRLASGELPPRPVIACDFAHRMLIRGAAKFIGRGALAIEADALHLPLRSGSVDLLTTAFGFRNLVNYQAGLAEFHRVLRTGGELGILDFSEPSGWIGMLYRLYFRRVLPAMGARLSGAAGPYAYLPRSVERFPAPAEMVRNLEAAGFAEVSWTPYTYGIAGLYRAVKPR